MSDSPIHSTTYDAPAADAPDAGEDGSAAAPIALNDDNSREDGDGHVTVVLAPYDVDNHDDEDDEKVLNEEGVDPRPFPITDAQPRRNMDYVYAGPPLTSFVRRLERREDDEDPPLNHPRAVRPNARVLRRGRAIRNARERAQMPYARVNNSDGSDDDDAPDAAATPPNSPPYVPFVDNEAKEGSGSELEGAAAANDGGEDDVDTDVGEHEDEYEQADRNVDSDGDEGFEVMPPPNNINITTVDGEVLDGLLVAAKQTVSVLETVDFDGPLGELAETVLNEWILWMMELAREQGDRQDRMNEAEYVDENGFDNDQDREYFGRIEEQMRDNPDDSEEY